jgi:hypothetical protein
MFCFSSMNINISEFPLDAISSFSGIFMPDNFDFMKISFLLDFLLIAFIVSDENSLTLYREECRGPSQTYHLLVFKYNTFT